MCENQNQNCAIQWNFSFVPSAEVKVERLTTVMELLVPLRLRRLL